MVQLWRNFGWLLMGLSVPAVIAAGLVALAFWWRTGFARSRRVAVNVVTSTLLVCWAGVVALITLTPASVAHGGDWPALEPVPFQQIAAMVGDSVSWQVPLVQLGGNVVLWIPGALVAAIRFRWGPWRCAWVGLVAGLAVELAQVGLATGRVASTDDVLLAGLGALVGGLVVAAARLWVVRRGARAQTAVPSLDVVAEPTA